MHLHALYLLLVLIVSFDLWIIKVLRFSETVLIKEKSIKDTGSTFDSMFQYYSKWGNQVYLIIYLNLGNSDQWIV